MMHRVDVLSNHHKPWRVPGTHSAIIKTRHNAASKCNNALVFIGVYYYPTALFFTIHEAKC